MLLWDILRRGCLLYADKPAVGGPERSFTYKQLADRATRFSNVMRDGLGLAKGDRIVVISPNTPEYIEIYFACALNGVVCVPVHNRWPDGRITPLIEELHPRAVVAHPSRQTAADAIRSAGFSDPVLTFGPSGTYESMLDRASSNTARAAGAATDAMVQIHTSGTTGKSKGVMLTQRNFLAAAWGDIAYDLARADDCHLVSTAIFLGAALQRTVSLLLAGGAVYLQSSFSPESVADLVSEARCPRTTAIRLCSSACSTSTRKTGSRLRASDS
jgi:acyl-CoA synthetase (AMP-forming)/AMP-acid ligase II